MRTALARPLAAAVGFAAVGLALTGGPAAAQSAEIAYTCDWYYGLDGGPTGTADSSGRFDTAITDGATVAPGDPINFDPSSGSFVLPEPFVDALRARGITEFFGYASVDAPWDVVGDRQGIGFDVPAVAVPASGPMTIQLSGARNRSRSLDEPGTYTLVAGQFGLVSDDDFSGMVCRVQPDVPQADRAIDTITVVEATSTPTTSASSTPTPATTSPSATRPALVQTDAAPPTGPSSAALAGLALVAASGFLAVTLFVRRRTAGRRH